MYTKQRIVTLSQLLEVAFHFLVREFMAPQGCWKEELPVMRQSHKGNGCLHERALGSPKDLSMDRDEVRA